jgi:pimeloyl-ACP methyl ester carboxylesterase
MPIFERDGVSLAYDVTGSGPPVLLFAPGGMRSRADMWGPGADGKARSWCDWRVDLAASHTVVAMDQRNAGRSRAPIRAGDGWHSYAGDHLALMDHLGFQRFATLGGCIGGSFCLKLAQMAPERITAQVLQNPIGQHPEHPRYFPEAFADWAKEQMAQHDDLDPTAVAQFGRAMWDGDFVFSIDRDFARHCATPSLVLPGDDVPHPAVIGQELGRIIPGAEVLEPWKGEHEAQRAAVAGFLARYTV